MKAKENILSNIESTNLLRICNDEDIYSHQKNSNNYKLQTRFPPDQCYLC